MAHRISINFVKKLRGYNIPNSQANSYNVKVKSRHNNALVHNTRSFSVSNVKNNSQHRVVLLPEVPPDNHLNNPLLTKFESNSDNATKTELNIIPEFNSVTDRNCYFGLGKALLEFEAAVNALEQRCEDGVKDFEALFGPFETALCQFQSVWNSVTMLNLTTDKFDRDRITILHSRAETAFGTRFGSRKIHETLKQMKNDSMEGKINLDEQQKRIIEKILTDFRLNGFDLTEIKYRELTETWMKRLAETKRDYAWRIMTSTEKYRAQIKDPNVVRDFPVDVLKAMSLDSTQPTKGPWTVTLHPYIYKQVMAYSPDRTLRWRLHEAKVTRGTKGDDIYTACQSYVREIQMYRFDVALTLGFKNFSEMSLYNKMAMNMDNVDVMFSSLVGKAKQYQEMELEQLQAYGASRGFDEDIEVYDVEFLKRKQRRTLLGMSDEDFRDFLPFPKVLTGIFRLCESLFDLKFEEVTAQNCVEDDFEKTFSNKRWSPEIKFYRVIDVASGGNNKILGEFFIDPYVRNDKGYAGGDKGWYIPIRPHSSIAKCKALGAMVLSLPIPNYGKPSLLNIAETEELLRNFGNLLVHMCSSRSVRWSDLSGRTALERDVIDFAGLFMTHWLYVPDILRSLSGHWSTNEPLPNNVIETLCTTAGKQHMAGYSLCNELFLAAYDMAFYGIDYEKEYYYDLGVRLRSEYLLLPATYGDAFPLYMSNIMSGEDAGKLYCKTWSKMLAADAFSAIDEALQGNGDSLLKNKGDILADEAVKTVTKRLRTTLLDKGSSEPTSEMFRQFRGRDPSHEALLMSLGMESTASPKMKGLNEAAA